MKPSSINVQIKSPAAASFFRLKRSAALLLYTVIIWSGCSLVHPRSDQTRYFVINTQPVEDGIASRSALKKLNLGLKLVELPPYLRGKSMVVRTGSNELYYSDFDRWAEPLEQGIARGMKDALCRTQNIGSVMVDSQGESTLDLEVSIRVLVCEGVRTNDGAASFHFAIAWEARSVKQATAPAQRGIFDAGSLPWNGTDYGDFAARLSDAVASAARAVAASLANETNAPDTTVPVTRK